MRLCVNQKLEAEFIILLNHIIIFHTFLTAEVGYGDTLEKLIHCCLEPLPHGQGAALTSAGTIIGTAFQA
jgi:hypothetical protein